MSTGQMPLSAPFGDYNRMVFVIQQELSKMQTATLVRVESCTNSGGLSPVGFVDVTPLVNQVDGKGNPTPHVTIFNIPYFRIQGGANAVIIDPQAGDVGICVFASRDISKIKTTKEQANPDSLRQFSFSDGLYLGGVLNGVPTQYVQFLSSGVKISSPTQVTIDAPSIVLNGAVSQTGGAASTFSGAVSAVGQVSSGSVNLTTHVHSGVTPGAGNTGGPI